MIFTSCIISFSYSSLDPLVSALFQVRTCKPMCVNNPLLKGLARCVFIWKFPTHEKFKLLCLALSSCFLSFQKILSTLELELHLRQFNESYSITLKRNLSWLRSMNARALTTRQRRADAGGKFWNSLVLRNSSPYHKDKKTIRLLGIIPVVFLNSHLFLNSRNSTITPAFLCCKY